VQRLIRGFEFRRRPSADAVLLARKRRKKRKSASKAPCADASIVPGADASGTPTPDAPVANSAANYSDSLAALDSRFDESSGGASDTSSFPQTNSSSILHNSVANASPSLTSSRSLTSSTATHSISGEEMTMEDVDEGFEENLLVVVVQRRSHEKVGMGLNIRGPSNNQRPEI